MKRKRVREMIGILRELAEEVRISCNKLPFDDEYKYLADTYDCLISAANKINYARRYRAHKKASKEKPLEALVYEFFKKDDKGLPINPRREK